MRTLPWFLILLFTVPAWAGEIRGEITLTLTNVQGGLKRNVNKLPDRRRIRDKFIKEDAYPKGKFDQGGISKGELKKEDERRHFVVFLTADEDGAKLRRSPKPQEILQSERRFRDHVTPVVLGSSIVFKNKDAFHHFIKCPADDALAVEKQGQNEDEERKPTKTGPLELFCNIHHKMNAFVFVTPNDFFTMPKNGKFVLQGVPPGTYVLDAWHPRIKAESQKVVVTEQGAATVNFKL